jgi:hypothetical protein
LLIAKTLLCLCEVVRFEPLGECTIYTCCRIEKVHIEHRRQSQTQDTEFIAINVGFAAAIDVATRDCR